MNRKLIEQGKGAFTITLPVSWIREHNLKGGDEIQLLQKEEGILISTQKKIAQKKIEIDNIKFTRRIGRVHLNAAYASGFDEIHLLKKIEPNDLYQNMGFAIMQASHTYVIKDISGVTTTDIADVFKRVFQMVLSFYTECYEDIFENNLKNQEILSERDAEINKFCNYLLRCLAKHEAQSALEGKILFTYAFCLEQISDEIMRFWRCASSAYITQETQELALKIKEHLQNVFIAFYTYKDVSIIYETKNSLRKGILESMETLVQLKKNLPTKKTKQKKEDSPHQLEPYLRMLKIVELSTDLTPLTLMMRFERK
jgi:phosphate uptake regulator